MPHLGGWDSRPRAMGTLLSMTNTVKERGNPAAPPPFSPARSLRSGTAFLSPHILRWPFSLQMHGGESGTQGQEAPAGGLLPFPSPPKSKGEEKPPAFRPEDNVQAERGAETRAKAANKRQSPAP